MGKVRRGARCADKGFTLLSLNISLSLLHARTLVLPFRLVQMIAQLQLVLAYGFRLSELHSIAGAGFRLAFTVSEDDSSETTSCNLHFQHGLEKEPFKGYRIPKVYKGSFGRGPLVESCAILWLLILLERSGAIKSAINVYNNHEELAPSMYEYCGDLVDLFELAYANVDGKKRSDLAKVFNKGGHRDSVGAMDNPDVDAENSDLDEAFKIMWSELYALEEELAASDDSPYSNLPLFRGIDKDGHFTKKRLRIHSEFARVAYMLEEFGYTNCVGIGMREARRNYINYMDSDISHDLLDDKKTLKPRLGRHSKYVREKFYENWKVLMAR
jgi:hypothetical protein